jgi:hypothetical protein
MLSNSCWWVILDWTVRQRHGLEPAQHTELGLRVTEPIEHHHPHQGLDIDLMAGAAKDAPQLTKAQRLPQFMERPDRIQRAGRLELHLRLGLGTEDRCTPGGLQQSVNHRIEGSTDLIEAPEGGYGALADAALVIAKRLDELDVAPWTGGRDLDMHATKIAGLLPISRRTSHPRDVPPQRFSENRPETRMKPRLAPSKRTENRVQLSNSGERDRSFCGDGSGVRGFIVKSARFWDSEGRKPAFPTRKISRYYKSIQSVTHSRGPTA